MVKKVAPIDPEPLVKNGLDGICKKQVEIETGGNVPTYLTKFYEYNTNQNILTKINDVNWQQLISSNNFFEEILKLPLLKEIASKVLMFRLDNGGSVFHSQTNEDIYEYFMSEAKSKLPSDKYTILQTAIRYLGIEEKIETWQKQFGFNSMYDEVFRIATNNNMRSAKLYFKDSFGSNYVLWMWRGDYLALGSGAEIGLYKKNEYMNFEHWDSVNFDVPMTLNFDINNIEHIFSWAPNNKQWWITGFNPNYPNVDVTKQVLVGTVNFSEHRDMYDSLKEQILNNESMKKYVIFEDCDSTIWINWYE